MRTNMKWILFGVAALALMGAMPRRAHATALGKVLRTVGNVDIVRGKRTRALQARDEFQADDVLRVSPKSAVTLVYYAGGARYALAAQSACRIAPEGPKTLTGTAPRALSPLAVELVQAAGQTNARYAGTVIRGGNEDGAPRHPWPIGAVRGPEVVLHWEVPANHEAASALRWEVSIQSAERAKTVLRQTLDADATECTVPDGLLKTGMLYRWTVRAVGGKRPGASCEAFLALLTPDERGQLQRLEQNAAPQTGGEKDLDASRLLAEIYERRALYPDALRVWTEIAAASPDDRDAQHSLARLREKLQQ